MPDVLVPEFSIKVFVEGEEIARFGFHRTSRNPQDWEITAALNHADSKQAVRAGLLACVAELASGEWESYTFVPEGGSETDDQLQLPWSKS